MRTQLAGPTVARTKARWWNPTIRGCFTPKVSGTYVGTEAFCVVAATTSAHASIPTQETSFTAK